MPKKKPANNNNKKKKKQSNNRNNNSSSSNSNENQNDELEELRGDANALRFQQAKSRSNLKRLKQAQRKSLQKIEELREEQRILEIKRAISEMVLSGNGPYSTCPLPEIRVAYKAECPDDIRPLSREDVLQRIVVLGNLGLANNPDFVAMHVEPRFFNERDGDADGVPEHELKALLATYLGIGVPADRFL